LQFYIYIARATVGRTHFTFYIMTEREKLERFLKKGRQSPPAFTLIGETVRFLYPERNVESQFETYAVWFSIQPTDEKNPDRVDIECLVPHCGEIVSVAYPNNTLSITNWMSHAFNNHPNVLTEGDYNKKKGKVGKKRRVSAGGEKEVLTLTRGEEKEAIAELICANGLPLSFTDSLGWKKYAKRHGSEQISRRVISDYMKEIEKSRVTEPLHKAIREYLAPREFNFGGGKLLLQAKTGISTDGWTDGQRRQMESFTIYIPTIQQATLSDRILVPCPFALALDHWKLGRVELEADESDGIEKGLYFDAKEHAKFVVECLSKVKYDKNRFLTPANVLKFNTDTTAGQPKMIENLPNIGGLGNLDADIKQGYPPETGPLYSECFGHVINLLTVDMKKIAIFSEAHRVSNELSVWLRASDKRMQVFRVASAKARPGMSVRKPVSFPSTRFFYAILQMKVLSETFDVLQYIFDNPKTCFGEDENETSVEFNDNFTTYKAHHPTVLAIVKLFDKQLVLMPKMGAARRYTTSLPGIFFTTIYDHVKSFANTAEGKSIPTVIDAYKCSLFHRIASVAVLMNGLDEKVVPSSSPYYNAAFKTKWELSNVYKRRVWRDDLVNAAAYLDPLVFKFYDDCGHNLAHATTFYVRLLKGCIVKDDVMEIDVDPDVPQNMSEANLLKQFKIEKNAIEKRKRTNWVINAEQFQMRKREDLRSLVALYRGKGLPLAQEEDILSEDQSDKTSEELIQDQVVIEMQAYQGIMKKLFSKNPDYFGKDAFENDCLERYKFWPAHADQLPLLNLCAQMLLGTALTAMENERFHSAAAFIHTKLRSRLTAESLERLTLSKIYIQEALKEENIKDNDVEAFLEAFGDDFDS